MKIMTIQSVVSLTLKLFFNKIITTVLAIVIYIKKCYFIHYIKWWLFARDDNKTRCASFIISSKSSQ